MVSTRFVIDTLRKGRIRKLLVPAHLIFSTPPNCNERARYEPLPSPQFIDHIGPFSMHHILTSGWFGNFLARTVEICATLNEHRSTAWQLNGFLQLE